MSTSVQVGNRRIDDNNPCFIIAEAGSNHDGKLNQAKQLIDVAAFAGADAVKFQLFRAVKLYPKKAGPSDYLKTSESIYEITRKMEMPYEWLPKLESHCKERNVLFLASVFDEESVDRIDPYVNAFKIASYEMTHIPLIRYVAAKGKPVIISTGTATMDEVATTVREFRKVQKDNLILMQCTAAYPAPTDSLNVRALSAMKSKFGVPVGLSDHSRDPLVGPLVAVSLGANLIEKHFTLDNRLPGPDHQFALEPPELEMMVKKVREAEKALGNGEKKTEAVEAELRAFARRGIFALRDIERGEVLTRENIGVLRAGKLSVGLEPIKYEEIFGKRARHDIQAESAIRTGDYD
jgi:N,N'-diacetyllegionaminate synthase